MSWRALLDLISAELGADAARRVEARARSELAGMRITITARPPLDVREIESIAPGRPRDAARALGVHPSTVYRALRRPIVR